MRQGEGEINPREGPKPWHPLSAAKNRLFKFQSPYFGGHFVDAKCCFPSGGGQRRAHLGTEIGEKPTEAEEC